VLLEHIFFDKNIIPYRTVSLYHSQHGTQGIQKIFGTGKFFLLALGFFYKNLGNCEIFINQRGTNNHFTTTFSIELTSQM
jgi:hypothetical protein